MRNFRSIKWYALTAALALTGTYAQAQTRVDANVQSGAQTAMTARHLKQVTGTKVVLQGNTQVGTIDDIIFTDGGCIDYFVVVHEGRYVVVPWVAGQFNWEQRVVTLNIDQQRFREIPTYTQQTITSVNFYEPAYVQRVNGFFNVNANVRTDRQDRTSGYQDPRGNQPNNRPGNQSPNQPNNPRPNNPPGNQTPNNPAPNNPAPNNPAPNNPAPHNPQPNQPNNPQPNNPGSPAPNNPNSPPPNNPQQK